MFDLYLIILNMFLKFTQEKSPQICEVMCFDQITIRVLGMSFLQLAEKAEFKSFSELKPLII